MTPYEEIMASLNAYKKRENKLKLQRKRIDKELDKIHKQKIVLAIIISGGDPKYIEEAFKDEL